MPAGFSTPNASGLRNTLISGAKPPLGVEVRQSEVPHNPEECNDLAIDARAAYVNRHPPTEVDGGSEDSLVHHARCRSTGTGVGRNGVLRC